MQINKICSSESFTHILSGLATRPLAIKTNLSLWFFYFLRGKKKQTQKNTISVFLGGDLAEASETS